MKCPVDNTQLAITERQGIEIDYCPTCRGIWLDRGELDKLIERSESYQPPRRDDRYEERQEERSHFERERHYDDDDDDDDDQNYRGHDDRRYDNKHGGKRHKKEGFLGDLFDF